MDFAKATTDTIEEKDHIELYNDETNTLTYYYATKTYVFQLTYKESLFDECEETHTNVVQHMFHAVKTVKLNKCIASYHNNRTVIVLKLVVKTDTDELIEIKCKSVQIFAKDENGILRSPTEYSDAITRAEKQYLANCGILQLSQCFTQIATKGNPTC